MKSQQTLSIIAFLLGIVWLQQLPELPDVWWVALLLPLFLLARWIKYLWFVGCLAAGFSYALVYATALLSSSFDKQLEGSDIVLVGVVASIPQVETRRVRFEFDIEGVESVGVTSDMLPSRVRLNIYDHKYRMDVGERWRLKVRLKSAHGFMNPGGFDYEGWLYRHRIGATGYIRQGEENQRLDGFVLGYVVDRWRSTLSQKMDVVLPDSEYVGIIKALAIGNRDDISDEQWQVLLKTGTNHLMAISGLHVGIIAGLCFFFGRYMWRFSPYLMNRWSHQHVGAVAAIIGAFIYAAMAGFSIPTQRALIMVVVFMLSLLSQRNRAPMDGLMLALLLVLLFDPLAVMDAGFWLSFAAVSFILLAMGGRTDSQGNLWWRWGRVHVALAIALLPITILFFQKASLVSPLANVFAVPWMTLCIVPLVLLGSAVLAVSATVGGLILQLADMLLKLGWYGLDWCAQLPLAQLSFAPAEFWLVIPAVLGCTWLMLPLGWPGRWLGVVWFAVPFLYPFPRPQANEVWFTLLDVGQGLSAVVQTREHVLVFDTGPRFSPTFNTGEAVVVPYLVHRGIDEVDALVVSHGDNDHIGGAYSLLDTMVVNQVLTSEMKKLKQYNPELCERERSWEWDGVQFEFLHPTSPLSADENNNSCVLKVSVQGVNILLSGDIERPAERQLLSTDPVMLQADLLVVPHHGSATSSTEEFIDAVSPQVALIPVGYGNRFNLPNDDVVQRYKKREITVLQTRNHGALSFKVTSEGIGDPESYRYAGQRYWTHIPTQK